MQYLLSWIAEFFPKETPPLAKIVEALENLGLSVADLKHQKSTFEGVLVADVLDVWPHPSSSRLRLARVATGDQSFQVVCGAANLASGQKVAFAPIGAKLQIPKKGIQKIQKATIRDQESFGMICSSFELGLDENHEGILVLPSSWRTGESLNHYFKDDALLQVELPSHRWDLLSHRGLARELSIHFWRAAIEEPTSREMVWPIRKTENDPKILIAEDAQNACWRYIGVLLTDIEVAPSPPEILWRLSSLGVKTINNIVDMTNYVLLDTGQPLHAFDWSKISGKTIEVRWARGKESLLALDGKNYELAREDLVIADKEKPIALAGIIGGELAKITPATRDVLLECAWFARGCVRRTARRLGIKTESSHRFERETDMEALDSVVARSLELITRVSPKTKSQGSSDTSFHKAQRSPIKLSLRDIESLLGFAPREQETASILRLLCDEITKTGLNEWTVQPRSFRSDLRLKEDIGEEILRFCGFESLGKLPLSEIRIPVQTNKPDKSYEPVESLINDLLLRFAALGFQEVINFPLLSEQAIAHFLNPEILKYCPEVVNPVSAELGFYRPSLLIGLYNNWKHNFNHGKRFLRFQETGYVSGERRWAALASGSLARHAFWQEPSARIFGFWDLLGIFDALAAKWSLNVSKAACRHNYLSFHPELSLDFVFDGQFFGHITQLTTKEIQDASREHPVVFMELNIDLLNQKLKEKIIRYEPFESLPSVGRDLALVVNRDVCWQAIDGIVKEEIGSFLAEIYPFDVYHSKELGPDKKSIAFRIVFRPKGKSLTHEEAQGFIDRALSRLEKDLGAKLRS